jgi:hypothetical protein
VLASELGSELYFARSVRDGHSRAYAEVQVQLAASSAHTAPAHAKDARIAVLEEKHDDLRRHPGELDDETVALAL